MVITAPEDIRPVLKSYANKYIPKAFSDYQEELRKQFNKEHREKMAHLHLKSMYTYIKIDRFYYKILHKNFSYNY